MRGVTSWLAAAVCACTGVASPKSAIRRDPHSHAEPDRVAVRHVDLDLTVDFAHRELWGTVRLELDRRDRTADLTLDTDGLVIGSAVDCTSSIALAYHVGPKQPVIGAALVVTPRSDCVEIAYRTGRDAGALLWVDPPGTSGKRKPMLFTQSEAIRARSWIPLQDSPGVRFTYDATVRVPDGLWAVMSAKNPATPPGDGVWRFRMDQPIPSYLMALAVGDLTFRALGPRTGVYAEPSMIDTAAYEFSEVEAMVTTAEKLYGPYRWERYDMLVLPPSFPYGGMENPRLTFLTPTAITGDRGLVSLIAHELAHSWSGNLVTNSTWSDLWLNEGFTTYVERRIMEELRGADAADALWYLGRKDLDEAFATTAPADTRLALDASGRDPDDVPGDAAYEKGALLLRTLERSFGRDVFDAFLRRRFDRRAFQSTDTATFEREATEQLVANHHGALSSAALARWIHDPGLPADAARVPSKRVGEIEAIAAGFVANGAAFPAKGWQTREWVVALRALPATIARDRLRALDETHHLSTTGNAEIAMYWLPLLVRADDREAAPAVEAFLMRVGRRRMVRPLYEAMVAKGGTWLELARQTYQRAKPLYHPIVRETLEKLVGEGAKPR